MKTFRIIPRRDLLLVTLPAPPRTRTRKLAWYLVANRRFSPYIFCFRISLFEDSAFSFRILSVKELKKFNSLAKERNTETERKGFEPLIPKREYNGLANRRLQPLGHLS